MNEKIAHLQLATALNEERIKQYYVLKAEKEHDVKTGNEEYIAETIGLGEDQGTSLAKQLTSFEQSINALFKEERNAVDQYNKDTHTKQKLHEELLAHEEGKTSKNSDETLERYIAKTDTWDFDINDHFIFDIEHTNPEYFYEKGAERIPE